MSCSLMLADILIQQGHRVEAKEMLEKVKKTAELGRGHFPNLVTTYLKNHFLEEAMEIAPHIEDLDIRVEVYLEIAAYEPPVQ